MPEIENISNRLSELEIFIEDFSRAVDNCDIVEIGQKGRGIGRRIGILSSSQLTNDEENKFNNLVSQANQQQEKLRLSKCRCSKSA